MHDYIPCYLLNISHLFPRHCLAQLTVKMAKVYSPVEQVNWDEIIEETLTWEEDFVGSQKESNKAPSQKQRQRSRMGSRIQVRSVHYLIIACSLRFLNATHVIPLLLSCRAAVRC